MGAARAATIFVVGEDGQTDRRNPSRPFFLALSRNNVNLQTVQNTHTTSTFLWSTRTRNFSYIPLSALGRGFPWSTSSRSSILLPSSACRCAATATSKCSLHLLKGVLAIDDQDANFINVRLVCMVGELLPGRLAYASSCRLVQTLDGAKHISVELPPLALEHKVPQRAGGTFGAQRSQSRAGHETLTQAPREVLSCSGHSHLTTAFQAVGKRLPLKREKMLAPVCQGPDGRYYCVMPPPVYVIRAPPPPPPYTGNQLFGPPSVGVLVSKDQRGRHGWSTHEPPQPQQRERRRRRPSTAPQRGSSGPQISSYDSSGHGNRRDLHWQGGTGRKSSGNSSDWQRRLAAVIESDNGIGGTDDYKGRLASRFGSRVAGFGISGSSLSVDDDSLPTASGGVESGMIARDHGTRYHEVAPRATPRTEAPASHPIPHVRNRRDLDGRSFGALSADLWPPKREAPANPSAHPRGTSGVAATAASAATTGGRGRSNARRIACNGSEGWKEGGGDDGRPTSYGGSGSSGSCGRKGYGGGGCGGSSGGVAHGSMPIRRINHDRHWPGTDNGAYAYDTAARDVRRDGGRGYGGGGEGTDEHGGRDWEGARADGLGLAGHRQPKVMRRWAGRFGGPFFHAPEPEDDQPQPILPPYM